MLVVTVNDNAGECWKSSCWINCEMLLKQLFCTSQSSVSTVYRWRCQVYTFPVTSFSGCRIPKLRKISWFFMKLFKNKRVQFFKQNVYSPDATFRGSLGEIGVRSIKPIHFAARYKIFYAYLPIHYTTLMRSNKNWRPFTLMGLKNSMSVNFDRFDYKMRSPRKLCCIHSRTYAT